MAFNVFDTKGFGQFEPNQVWFTRTGAIEAQCALDPEVFAGHFPMTAEEAAGGKIYGEVGAFYAVDKTKKIVTVPTAETDTNGCPVGVNYSTEHIYNQFTPGRRNFAMITGEFLPRIGFNSVGERFTTNTVCYDTTYGADSKTAYDAIKTAIDNGTTIFAVLLAGSNGKLVIGGATANALGGIYTKVVKAYTNADGTPSFMFEVINKPVSA